MALKEQALSLRRIVPGDGLIRNGLRVQEGVLGARGAIQKWLREREACRRIGASFEEGQLEFWRCRQSKGEKRRPRLISGGRVVVLDWEPVGVEDYAKCLVGILSHLSTSKDGRGKVGVRVRNGQGPAKVIELDRESDHEQIRALIAGFTLSAAKYGDGRIVSLVQQRVCFEDCLALGWRMEELFSSFSFQTS